MKEKIIEECKKYGYLLDYEEEENGFLQFKNAEVREELQIFNVMIREELEYISMAIIIDLGSWNEATDADMNNMEEVSEQIKLWLSPENLAEVEKYFLEDQKTHSKKLRRKGNQHEETCQGERRNKNYEKYHH